MPTRKTLAANTKTLGFHRDPITVGLYLQVTPRKSGGGVNRSWVYRYKSPSGKARWLGLGSAEIVSLADARQLAKGYRYAVRVEGRDPVEERLAQKAAAIKEDATAMTFADCVDAYIAQHGPTWKNDKHRKQWRSTLTRACKAFGKVRVDAVETGTVVKFLEPIWTKTPETASRTRGRIEKVLDWATAAKLRKGPNPARWQRNLEHLLARQDVAQRHHSAMPWAEVPAFVQLLRERDSLSARALEFTLLTAARTGEAIGARWEEFDFDAKVWTVPADRMKAKQEHQVPLSDRAVEILNGIERSGELVFPLSNMAMTQCLRKAGGGQFTVHGFRSSFRDWCGERTNFERQIIEFALAHKLPDRVERAYRRETAVEKRRMLMQTWATYCAQPATTATITDLAVARGTKSA